MAEGVTRGNELAAAANGTALAYRRVAHRFLAGQSHGRTGSGKREIVETLGSGPRVAEIALFYACESLARQITKSGGSVRDAG